MAVSFVRKPISAIFLERINRFMARVELNGTSELAHIANSGRLQSILQRGRPCWVIYHESSTRKTKYSLLAVEVGPGPVVVDAHLPNHLIASSWSKIPELACYAEMRPEYRLGDSRVDFAFFNEGQKSPACLLEVKSAADCTNQLALFPDSPSKRAAKHIASMNQAVRQGVRAIVLLLAQMEFVDKVALNASVDPGLVRLAGQAKQAGVEFIAYGSRVRLPEEVGLGRRLELVHPLGTEEGF